MEVDIRFAAGEIEGTGVAFGERIVPLGFRVVPLALLSLLSREAVDRPLVFVLTGRDVMDTREVDVDNEVLRDTLVDASDGVPFFVFVIDSNGENKIDSVKRCWQELEPMGGYRIQINPTRKLVVRRGGRDGFRQGDDAGVLKGAVSCQRLRRRWSQADGRLFPFNSQDPVGARRVSHDTLRPRII